MEQACPFCSPEPRRVVGANSLAIALRDGFPVSPGHTLIVPRRHIASMPEAAADELSAMWSLLTEARRGIESNLRPNGFNIGINDGRAAGQTVMHLHVHLIPRFAGDSADPRGGVCWVLPAKAKYWD
jgi:diadenosine tetraphosphate (Ap4A) HIT family hydrolase